MEIQGEYTSKLVRNEVGGMLRRVPHSIAEAMGVGHSSKHVEELWALDHGAPLNPYLSPWPLRKFSPDVISGAYPLGK
jgi:hypothetical protein